MDSELQCSTGAPLVLQCCPPPVRKRGAKVVNNVNAAVGGELRQVRRPGRDGAVGEDER